MDDLAQIVDAKMALDALWARVLVLGRKPYVSRDDVNCMSCELRRIQAGLATTQKWLVNQLENEGKSER